MYYVYLIKSLEFPERIYAGYTTNLKQRLETHNSGGSIYTANYRPWKLILYLGFADESKAKEFELYLKTSAGKAFAKKHFL
jgi:putative endonuclease